jgi:hypothetical protein
LAGCGSSLAIGPWTARATRGALVAEGRALCADRGSVKLIDMVTGEILSESPLPKEVPFGARCESLRTGVDIALVCRGNQGNMVASFRDGIVSLEKTFPEDWAVTASRAGALAIGGPCDGDDVRDRRADGDSLSLRDVAVACARGADGQWREYDLRKTLKATNDPQWKTPGKIVWIPRDAGAPLGFFAADHGQRLRLDSATSDVMSFASQTTFPVATRDPDGTEIELDAAGPSVRALRRLIGRSVELTDGGDLRTWGLVLRYTGAVETFEVSPQPAGFDGPFGLATTRDGRLRETRDWGRTWTDVAAPPGTPPQHAPPVAGCSEVGCFIPPFVRLGWGPDTPVPRFEPALAAIADSIPPDASVPRPRLDCTATGPARSTRPSTLRTPGDPTTMRAMGETIRSFYDRGSPEDDLMRAAMAGPDMFQRCDSRAHDKTCNLEGTSARVALRYHLPCDPGLKPRVDSTSLLAEELDTMWRPDHFNWINRRPFDFSREAVPVASTHVESSAGLLLPLEGPLLWVRPGAPPRLFHPRDRKRLFLLGAASMGPSKLAVLVTRDDEGSTILVEDSDGERVDLELDFAALDWRFRFSRALAVASDGRIGVIGFVDTERPPSPDTPAWLVVRGESPRELAPWESLVPGDADECRESAGLFSAILSLPGGWLDLHDSLDLPRASRPLLAQVRWGEARVCLDAVEMAVGDPQDTTATVIARFAPERAAGRVARLGSREQTGQALRCTLSAR